jgi:predicted nucleic acid-binding Zn ribbon protein
VQIETFDLSGKQPRMVLRADSTAWATQVRLMTATIAERIDQELGDGRNTEVTILGPTAPSWKHGMRSVPGRGPRDTYG